jgi:polysaccharide pyruvyl transferase WcaK-like protein
MLWASKMNKSPTITVITKLSTPNAGNQAVSTELIRLLKRTCPDARTYAGWQEPGLERYSLARLKSSGQDSLNTLDLWAERILKEYDSNRKRNLEHAQNISSYELSSGQNNLTNLVKLNSHVPPLPLRFYNKGKRTLRALLDRQRVYGRNYENWLNILARSDWVIYSPAGALLDLVADDVVRDFLGLRIAQKMGAKIAAVNQSIEIKRPLLLNLLGQLYSGFDVIVVRDPASAQRLEEIQVPQEKINLAPDTAYLAYPVPADDRRVENILKAENIKPGTVGIAVQPRENGFDYSDWGRVIETLRTRGKEVMFVSHEMATDGLAGKELLKRYNVKNLSRQYDYDEYIHILSQLEMVISERYHTCVFSTIAGTPFIPLNVWEQRKMYGIVWALDYPIPAVESADRDWVDVIQKNIEYIYEYHDRIASSLRGAMPRLRKMAEENVRWDST